MPASMFAENGEMRIGKTKVTLKQNLQVETPQRLTPQPDVTITDGCAILWVIHWPNRGNVRDFVDSFTSFIFGNAERCDKYLIFDRYHDFSIKSRTQLARAGQQASRCHKAESADPAATPEDCSYCDRKQGTAN